MMSVFVHFNAQLLFMVFAISTESGSVFLSVMCINCAFLNSFMHFLSDFGQLNWLCCKIDCKILIFYRPTRWQHFFFGEHYFSPSTCISAMVAPCKQVRLSGFALFIITPLPSTGPSFISSYKMQCRSFATIAHHYNIMSYNLYIGSGSRFYEHFSFCLFWDHN